VAFPIPVPGLVIRYSFLWRADDARGLDEGDKDRPCAVILVTTDSEGQRTVIVLPITHAPPRDPKLAVEIPAAAKRRLGLDDERSWIALTDANRFVWPGPDLRPSTPGDAFSVAYGLLPRALFVEVRERFAQTIQARLARVVRRTD